MLVHCWAGISRSTAAAYIALCTLNEDYPEADLALLLRRRGAHAQPYRLIVRLADDALGRKGRMRAALEALTPPRHTWDGALFVLPAHPRYFLSLEHQTCHPSRSSADQTDPQLHPSFAWRALRGKRRS